MNEKILITGPTPPPYNGVSVVTENLLSNDMLQDFKFIIVDTADRRGLTNIGKMDLENVFLALKHGILFLYKLIRYNPSIVYIPISENFFGFIRDSLFLIPTKFMQKKCIIHLHGAGFKNFFESSAIIIQKYIKFCLGNVNEAIVLGEALKDIVCGILNENTNISVVPNGIHDNHTTKYKVSNEFKILFLSNLKPSKGFLEVVYSAKIVSDKYSNVRFLIAGAKRDEKTYTEAMDFVKKNQLEDIVLFLGSVSGEQKIKILNQTNIFVFPPNSFEGQGLVILEAMAAGLPVIATAQGAIPETIIDGETGFIIPPKNPEKIAEKISFFIENPDQMQSFGTRGRKRFEENYTLDIWGRKMHDVFKRVLDQ